MGTSASSSSSRTGGQRWKQSQPLAPAAAAADVVSVAACHPATTLYPTHTPPTHLRGLDLQGQSPVVVLNGALGQILQAAGQAGQQGEAGAGQGWKQACPGVVACVQREGWAHTQATAKTRALAQACARGSEGTNKLYTSKLSGSASACLLDPGVLEDLRDGDALRGVGHQDLLDQVAALSGD